MNIFLPTVPNKSLFNLHKEIDLKKKEIKTWIQNIMNTKVNWYKLYFEFKSLKEKFNVGKLLTESIRIDYMTVDCQLLFRYLMHQGYVNYRDEKGNIVKDSIFFC